MKFARRILIGVVAIVFAIIIYALIFFPPILAGMAAKTMCSCVFVMNRDPATVVTKELSVFPGLSKARFDWSKDSAVTAHVLWTERKAVFRKGLGCTLLAQRTEQEVRNQKWRLASLPMVDQSKTPWPAGDVLNDSALAGVDYMQIRRSIDSAFIDIDPTDPVNTLAVVAVYDGKIIGEKYAVGISKDSPLMGWSMTKSITNALVGILVGDGKLRIEEAAPVPEWRQDERKNIALNDLLHASSGLDWSELYFLPGDFHNMFIYSDDKGGYAASRRSADPPNTHFKYSSGTTNILSRIVRQTVGDSNYFRFPYERLFFRIGMQHTLLEPDASGTFVGSSYGFASARDWARFGLLYLNDGVWNGDRILPEGWVKYTITPAPASQRREYGAQWWLNLGEPGNPANCKEPGLPADTYLAEGFERQYVAVIPSHKLVIVRLGITHNSNFSLPKLVNGIIRGLPK